MKSLESLVILLEIEQTLGRQALLTLAHRFPGRFTIKTLKSLAILLEIEKTLGRQTMLALVHRFPGQIYIPKCIPPTDHPIRAILGSHADTFCLRHGGFVLKMPHMDSKVERAIKAMNLDSAEEQQPV